MSKTVFVKKASGKSVPFSEEKLIQSLQRSGAQAEAAKEIAGEVSAQLHEGMTTRNIYRKAFGILKKRPGSLAARYHLKKAIMELGPSGYPFEKFIGEILRSMGYAVEIGKIVKGHCVNHELDAIAQKDNHHFMVECKYHNRQGVFSDVKIPLYIQARFKDIEQEWKRIPGHSEKFHQAWVVTNTRFTADAMQYGSCAGMKLISWDYPARESLKYLIDKMGLYPVTCLTSLTKHEKKILLDRKVVLCREICGNSSLLSEAGVQQHRIASILQEGIHLCGKPIEHGIH